MQPSNPFTHVEIPNNPVSRFNLSHDLKLSFRLGEIVPTALVETLPGDKFNISVENMLRFAPLISPVMHKVHVTTHWFFVPNRIMWNNFDKWITGDLEVEAPYILVNQVEVGSLLNYMGLPVGAYPKIKKILLLPLLAYIHVYNEYYRDQNLVALLNTDVVSGDNTTAFLPIFNQRPLKRAWQHDYFTSCLPWAQKGDAVQVPLTFANDIPVDYTFDPAGGLSQNTGRWVRADNGQGTPSGDVNSVTGPPPFANGGVQVGGQYAAYDPFGTLTVDIQSDAVDINTLRRAFALQKWLERNARGGTRYTENILAHFGTKSSDARLQRPEYIGGTKQNMVISEVLSTVEATTTPQGNMAGHGISIGGGNRFDYYCEEHGIIIGMVNVQPDTAYFQGIHRMFKRHDRLDYAWPIFANIGEQEVYTEELYAYSDTDNAVFGYIPRYSEYRYLNSRVAGEMSTNLDFWHMARKFDTQPSLNDIFISADPTTRIFAVQDGADHIYAHIFHNVFAVRKLPKFGVPSI